MKFMIYTEDKDDGLDIRTANREAHLTFLKAGKDVEVLTAGPWLDEDGTMRGSLLIVEARDIANVRDWANTDPYKMAGLPKSVTIHPFIWAIGAPGA